MWGTRRLAAFVGIAMVAVLAGCTGEPEADTKARHGVTLIKGGTLTVCTEIPYPPFEYRDGGEIVGFDVDMLRLVAGELGVKLELRHEPFEQIRSGSALAAKRCDAAAAGILISKDREEQLDLSEGYFDLRQGMLVKAGKPYRDLASLGTRTVGVERNTTGEAYLRHQIKGQGLKLKLLPYEDLVGLQQAVLSGAVEAAVADLPVWTEYDKEQPGVFEVAATFDTGEQYGIAVKPGNAALLTVVNSVIGKARQDGTYDKLYQKWIGPTGK